MTPRLRHSFRFALVVSLIVMLGVALVPISTGFTRMVGLTTIAVATLLTGILAWRSVALRSFHGALVLATALLCLGPGRPFIPESLRAQYLSSLLAYEGSAYVWGGETRLGIDCSGLVRKGLINASIHQGIRTLNPRLLRLAFDLWWHDATAKALGEGYRGLTKSIAQVPRLAGGLPVGLMLGDLAVTSDGVHVLVYLGDSRWLEADPYLGHVVLLRSTARNPWLTVPVRLVRWRALDDV